MAVIIRNPREIRIQEQGARGVKEALLAGPASGSNRFTVRRITLAPDGCTARTSFDRAVVYLVLSGRISLSHDNGELDLLSPGDSAILRSEEVHHLHNIDKFQAHIVKVASQ